MSIWSSGTIAGADEEKHHDGSVISYIEGWSNHYPYTSLPAHGIESEHPASVGVGYIPPWCVPGNFNTDESGDDGLVGPWLRLDVVKTTVRVGDFGPAAPEQVHSVCMTESAVEALRDVLTEWLSRPKLHPQEGK